MDGRDSVANPYYDYVRCVWEPFPVLQSSRSTETSPGIDADELHHTVDYAAIDEIYDNSLCDANDPIEKCWKSLWMKACQAAYS